MMAATRACPPLVVNLLVTSYKLWHNRVPDPHLLGASLLDAPHCLVYLKVVVGRQHCNGLIQLRVVEDAVRHLLPHKAAHRGRRWR